MDMNAEQENPSIDLRDIAKGFIRFTIRAADTIENKQVHDSFKEFSKIEADNNYTLALRKLLEFYQADYKTEMLHSLIVEQNVVLAELKGSVEYIVNGNKSDKKKDEPKLF